MNLSSILKCFHVLNKTLFLPLLNFQFLIYLWHVNHSLNHHLLRKYMPGDGATKVSKIVLPKPQEHTNKKVIPNNVKC